MPQENGRAVGGENQQGERPDQGREVTAFQSNLHLFVTCIGCAAGTGNIWRFPRIVANNSEEKGGGVFLIVWLLFLVLWSVPMLLVEYGIGRYTKKSVVGSFRTLFSDRVIFLGAWIVMVSFCITCYYSVILGWCFYYTLYSAFVGLPATHEESQQIFQDYAKDSRYLPVLTTFSAVALACFSVIKGVKTIERVSLVLVPALLIIIVFSFFGSLFMPHSWDGIAYLFTPDVDSFTDIRTWIDALSQNAFDTGAGTGLMLTFSSYMTAQHGIVRYSRVVPLMNNAVSLICAMALFGGMFSTLITHHGHMTKDDIVHILKDNGPGNTGLSFIWLPLLFNNLDTPGRAVAFFFFLCLSFSGLTSLISNIEMFTRTITDFGVPRKIAIPACFVLVFGISLMSSLNIKILDNQDFVWGFGLIVNGMVLVGAVIAFGPDRFINDLVNNYTLAGHDWRLHPLWKWVIIVILPIEGMCLLIWWAIDLLDDPKDTDMKWTEVGEKTFMTAIIEWFGVFLLVFIPNVIYISCRSFRHRARNAEYPPLNPANGNRNENGSYNSIRPAELTTEFAHISLE